MDPKPSQQKQKIAHRRKRPVGRPPKGDECVKGRRGSGRTQRKALGSWSDRTKAYIKMVTGGKGAPCKIWSVVEKRQLLEGLKKYSHQDWDSLCKKVPTRTKEEIQEYIHQLKGGVQCKRKGNQDAQLTWAPIESWLDMSTEMIHYEQEDLSNILSRVFSIIGNFSHFPECTSPALEPDYGKLYRYIAAVMDESLSMPTLTPLESAIIADLMHGLGDRLRMSDTSLQRKVMCWKYKMLNHKFDFDDVRASLDRIRRALTNDFSDLQRGSNQSVSRLSSFGQTSTATITQATTSEASAGHPGTSDSASPAVGPPSSQPPSRQSEADKDATNQTPSSESDKDATNQTPSSENDKDATNQTPSSESDKDATNQTSSSENDKDATNQTPSSESGAAGLAASQNSESAVSTFGDASLNPSLQDSSRTAETSEAELAGDEGGGPTKRKPGRQRVHDWRRPIEKPRLYSMNPFCVPIRLLRLKPLLAATPSAAASTTSTTGRRQSVSSSQSEASTSSYPWQKRLKNTKEAANQELEWNSIRQVTGLYKPTVPTSRKKKEAMHKTLLPAKMQVSSATMDAMKAALALRSKHKAVVESSAKPAGAVAPAKTVPSSPVITLPGGQRVVQVTSKASSIGTVPTHAFRCIKLPDGKMALVPVTVTKLGSSLNPAPSASEGTLMPQPREQQQTPQAAPATSPSVSGIPSPFQSPLRAPLAGCSVSVGTSDENSQEVPTTIASRVRGSSLSVGKPQASAKLSEERMPQGRTADDKGVSEGSRGRSASTAGRKVVSKSGSGPKVTKQTDECIQQSRPVSSSSCHSDTTERRATRPQRLERSATRPQPAKEGAKQSQPVQQKTAQPQLVEHRAAQPQPVEQKHAQSQPVEQRKTPIAVQRTAPSQPVVEQKTAPSQQVVEQKTAQSQPTEQKLGQPLPAEQREAQLQPTEQRPAQPQPLEQRAVLSQAVELRATQSQPAKQRPAQPPPAEQRPAQPPLAEQRPAQPPPAEQRPAQPPPAEQRPAQPPPAEQRPAQPPPAEQRPAQPPPAEQRPAQPQPPEKRTTAQSQPAKRSSPSVIQSSSSENMTGTQKQSSSGKSVVRRCSADGFQTEGIRSPDTARTVRPGSGDLLGQRTVARSVLLNHLEVTSSEPRTATQSCSVDQPKAVCSAGPHPRPRPVVRSVSCKSAPSRQSGQAVVIKTLSRSHFSRGSAADWSINPDSEARQSTSENVQSSSSDDGSPSLRLTRPVKTYTRMPGNKAMGEKAHLLSFKDRASAQSEKNSQRVLQPISRTPKMSQQREVGQKPPCIIYVSPKTPLATDAGQEKTPPSSTNWKKGPPSTKKPGSTKTHRPAKTPPSSDTGQKTPQSAAVGKKTMQPTETLHQKTPWPTGVSEKESPSTNLRTAQSSTSPKTAQPATSQKTTQSVTGPKTTLSAASQKTAQSATSQKTAPPATGQKSAPPATGQKTAPPATGQKSAPPATGQKSAPPATGQKSAPPTMSLNKGVKSSFKTILAQVASPHVTPSKQKSAPTPRQPNAETASPGGSPQNCSVAASPSGTRPSSSSSLSSTSTPSPAKKLKLAKKFLVKQEPAGAAQNHSTTPAGEGKQKSQASYPKAKKRPANYLAEQDISNMQVEYVTVDAAKKRMRIPAGRPQKAYEAERQQRMGSALKLGRPTLQMRLDDEEISLVSI